jgi:hypothetical protein
MNSPSNPLCGMYSDGTNVYCVQSASIKIFSAQQEKWREFPCPKGMSISPASQLFLDKNALVFVEGASIFRYIIDAQSWDVISAPSPVIDMLSQDTVIFYLTSGGAFQYFTRTSVTRPLDIPGIEGVRCFTRIADTLYCATQKNYSKYDISSKTSDNVQAPQNVVDFSVLKTVMMKDTIIALCPAAIVAYGTKSRLWQSVPLSASNNKRAGFSWNDDNGAKLDYTRGAFSQLRGNVQQNLLIDSATPGGASYTVPVTYANLTLHNKFSSGNYCDIFFDNTDINQVAKKGAFYRGTPQSRVESARLGTNTIDLPQSSTILQSQFEGGAVVLQSKSSLATRDRKVAKVQAGGGLITTRTDYEVLPYSTSGIYRITSYRSDTSVKKTIVPGSLKVTIDGETIDSADYTFFARIGSLTFNRHDLLDPTSLIAISYQVKTVPDSGVSTIEFLPENNFGTVGYVSATVSPVDWISPQAGVVHVRTGSVTHELVDVSAPAEIRSNSSNIFLKFNPEITYDAQTHEKAAAISFQSRFGEKLGLLFNGFLPDSGFVTTDNLDRGYSFLKRKTDFTVDYDLRKELPLSYSQHDFISAHGIERRYALNAGSHFQGFPFLDVSLSRNTVKTDQNDTIADSSGTLDSITSAIDRSKDKFRIRLYETSSPIVESALHINRLNYELSYTGFSSHKEGQEETGHGSIFYGRGTVSPINRLMLTLLGTYLKNAPGSQFASEYNPSFLLQTIDAPPGFDISFRNDLDFKSIAGADSSFSTLRRMINCTIKPGAWRSGLNWIQPLIGFNQTLYCGFTGYAPGGQALLLPENNVMRKNTTKSVGANIFPSNDITFRNDNQFSSADSSIKYYSFNDLKWWFGDKRVWQTRWEYDRDRPRYGSVNRRDYHRGYSYYSDNWTPWLQTITGVSLSITESDSVNEIKMGPDITVSLNTGAFSVIRSLQNNHSIHLAWIKSRQVMQSSPDILYTMYLRVTIRPNISLAGNNSFVFSKGSFSRYNGLISVVAVF